MQIQSKWESSQIFQSKARRQKYNGYMTSYIGYKSKSSFLQMFSIVRLKKIVPPSLDRPTITLQDLYLFRLLSKVPCSLLWTKNDLVIYVVDMTIGLNDASIISFSIRLYNKTRVDYCNGPVMRSFVTITYSIHC